MSAKYFCNRCGVEVERSYGREYDERGAGDFYLHEEKIPLGAPANFQISFGINKPMWAKGEARCCPDCAAALLEQVAGLLRQRTAK